MRECASRFVRELWTPPYLFAALAEKERALISQRTKAGLAAAKARGTKLGNPDMDRLRGLGVKAVKAEADRHAATVRPIIEKIQARGAASLRAIAAELTRMRVPTARGGAEWSAQQVSRSGRLERGRARPPPPSCAGARPALTGRSTPTRRKARRWRGSSASIRGHGFPVLAIPLRHRLEAALRDEIARLKGGPPRPNIKPSGMEQATDSKPPPGAKRSRGDTRSKLSIDEERIVKLASPPPGARFKGTTSFVVQDLVIRRHVVDFRRQRWLAADGRMLTAPLPAGIDGHFGPELRRFVLAQYHQGQTTAPGGHRLPSGHAAASMRMFPSSQCQSGGGEQE
jgi:hypothetical protein